MRPSAAGSSRLTRGFTYLQEAIWLSTLPAVITECTAGFLLLIQRKGIDSLQVSMCENIIYQARIVKILTK